ncbi:uncharacterized protein DUF547 [Mariniflexile fucanivorans]|uniref:Uncharacterized protein DUF547 n=1 Tax=Mariniflexile fucanivorans TaxID=264023 RepID=A0A4R1RA43_9FLAO|nr:DUF547 domain-containing protein [Mariniflexile fucanivorans]TCL62614.1 uncharacterized protein DUF547 [Mariniflexile fucanivorans]
MINKTPNPLVALSGALLLHVKLNKDTTALEQKLGEFTLEELQRQLSSDEAKKTFWINIYNAYFQMLSNSKKVKRKTIFKVKSIEIAQKSFSLDDIEHGILRRYRMKQSFGYLHNPFVSSLIKVLAVKKLDYRIHFALNCGAKSCPPIAFYTLEKLDEELNFVMESFLDSETSIDENNKTISTSKLLYWYCADFGGYFKIKNVLKDVLNRDFTNYKLSFKEYSWDTQLNNYL